MSIRLTVEASDPEVEGLLEYLEANCRGPWTRKMFLLERTIGWLRPVCFLVGIDSRSHSSVVVENPNTPCEQHQDTLAASIVDK
jgi:hypothetical protein